MNEDLEIRGSLEESDLPELLHSICKSKESGVLKIHVGEYEKSIYFSEGQIIFATSTNPDDRLGESLLRHGKITVRQFYDASRLIRVDRRLGEILCEMNAISPEELVEGVRLQTLEIINDLFQLVVGQYELQLKPVQPRELVLLGKTTEDIIFDGIKSIESWIRIQKGVGPINNRLSVTLEATKTILNLTLAPEESHLLFLCEKAQFNIEEICGMSYLNSFDTCRTLWGFMVIGAVESTKSDEIQPEPVPFLLGTTNAEYDLNDLVENYNDLYSFMYDYIFERIGEEADELADRAMLHVRNAMPRLGRELTLDTYGRLDFDSLLRNIGPLPEDGRTELITGALEEIVYALLYEIGSYFGTAEQQAVTEALRKMRKN